MLKSLLLWATIFGVAFSQCPMYFQQYGNTCYRGTYHPSLPWSQAEGFCQDLGGHLASIHDNATTSFLLDLARQNSFSSGWIGLRDRGSGPTWSDKTSVNYTSFAPTQDSPPTCYLFSAVAMYYPGKWISIACDQEANFICERPLGLPATTINPFTCGPDSYYGNNGTIQSPGYPQPFGYVSCNWQISVFNNYANLEFPPIKALGHWSLDIYSGTQAFTKNQLFSGNDYYGLNNTLKLSSPNPQILIVFKTAAFDAVDPFLVHYSGTEAPLYPIPSSSTKIEDSESMDRKKSNLRAKRI